MNERIQELAAAAKQKVPSGLDVPRWIEVYNEELARLVVQECIAVVQPTEEHEVWAQGYLGGVDGLELLDHKIKKIKQHFGIE